MRQKSVSEHLKPARVRLAFRTAKRINGRTNPNVHKTAVLNHLLPGCTRQTTGDSRCPEVYIGDGRRRHRLAIGNVGELKVAARLKDPPYLCECLLLVGAEIDHAIGYHNVGPSALHGK